MLDVLEQGEFEAGVERVRNAPADGGTLELIVRRPAPAERELLEEAGLIAGDGLAGDRWAMARKGGPEFELTVTSARALAMFAGGEDHARWAEAGDQLYLDLDLSEANLPPGARLRIGEVVIEVTAAPHRGCGKFLRRFGAEALKLANTPEGRALRLRGLHARVIEAGTVRRGDRVEVLR